MTVNVSSSQYLQNIKEVISKGSYNGIKSFLELIDDYNYNFPTGVTPRVMKLHTDENLIHVHRNHERGKRWFSLKSKIALDIILHVKSARFAGETSSIMNALNEPMQEDALCSVLDYLIVSAITLIGVNDVYLAVQLMDGNVVLGVTDSSLNESFNVSEYYRNTIALPDGRLSIEEKVGLKFLGLVAKEVDGLRDVIGIAAKINDKAFEAQKAMPFGVYELASDNDVRKLTSLPVDVLKRRYDIIYTSEKGNLFGIEVKYLGDKSYLEQLQMEIKASCIDELTRALQMEIGATEMYMEKRKNNNNI